MMNKIQSVMAKRAAGEKGFTLVELLVVVVILVVLAAIAVPLFLNQKAKAEDAKAQSNVATIAAALATGKATGATGLVTGNGTPTGTVDLSSDSAGEITVGLSGATVTGVATTAPAAVYTNYCVTQGGFRMNQDQSAPVAGTCI